MKIVPPQLLPKLLGIRFDKITQNGMNELDIFKTLTLVRVIFWEFFFFFFFVTLQVKYWEIFSL